MFLKDARQKALEHAKITGQPFAVVDIWQMPEGDKSDWGCRYGTRRATDNRIIRGVSVVEIVRPNGDISLVFEDPNTVSDEAKELRPSPAPIGSAS